MQKNDGDFRVNVYHGKKLVCRFVTLADCYPGEPDLWSFAAAMLRRGQPYITHAARLVAAT